MSYPSIAANFGPWSDCFQNATSCESSDGISNFGRLGSWLRGEKALRGGSCEDSRLNRRGLISLFPMQWFAGGRHCRPGRANMIGVQEGEEA
jgi:hypothetical protein